MLRITQYNPPGRPFRAPQRTAIPEDLVIPLRTARSPSPRPLRGNPLALALLLSVVALSTAGCGKEAPKPAARPPVDVTAVTLEPRDTPVAFEFVGQTQSSREVEIRARVDGFLEKRVYIEGELVRTGQPMFLMDRKPFEASLQQAKGELAQRQAQLDTAKANLTRIRPLAEQNAVSKKDLDDAVGAYQSAEAQVLSAKGNVRSAELNLGYTTIASPLTGLSSFAKVQDGAYVNASNNLLTTVSQLDPIWVNYSVSENELLRSSRAGRAGAAQGAAQSRVRGRGGAGRRQRVSQPRPRELRGSLVQQGNRHLPRARGAGECGPRSCGPGSSCACACSVRCVRTPILVPQRAVQQGAKSHFVWVIGKDDKVEQRVVEVGDWHGQRLVHQPGPATRRASRRRRRDPPLRGGGGQRGRGPCPRRGPVARGRPGACRTAGARHGATAQPGARRGIGRAPRPERCRDRPAARPAGPLPAYFFFDPDSATLTAEARAAVASLAAHLKQNADARVHVTGYADKTGTRARNLELAKARAKAIHLALREEGVGEHQLNLKAPVDFIGGPDNRQARRVDVHPALPGTAPSASPQAR